MSDADGHVIITTEIDTSQYEQSLREIRSNTQTMNNNLVNMSQRTSRELQNAARLMNQSVSSITREASEAVRTNTQSMANSLNSLNQNTSQRVSQMAQEMGQLSNTLSQATSNQIARNAQDLSQSLNALNQAAAGEIASSTNELARSLSRVSSQVGAEVEASTAGITRSIDEMTHFASSQLQGTTQTMARAIRGISGQVTQDISANAAQLNKAVDAMGSTISAKFREIGAALGLAIGVKEFAHLAGVMTDLESRAAIASKGMMDVSLIMSRLRDIADKAYSPLEKTATAFMNNSFALNDLGMSMERQLDLTDALTNALVVSGAKGEMFELVMNAVNRSLAIGKMGGEELEMVMKYGGAAAEAIAGKLGTTINGLKELARNGELTADVISGALVDSLEELRSKSEAMPATIGDSMVRLGNQITASIGQINSQTGIGDNVVKGIDAIKNNMSSLVDILPYAVTGMMAFIAAKSNFGKAINTSVVGHAASVKAIMDENKALGVQSGLLPAIKQHLTGISASISGQIPLHSALAAAITGDSHAAAGLARANQLATASNVAAAKAAQRSALADFQLAEAAHAAAAGTIQAATTRADLAAKTTALAAAERNLYNETMKDNVARNELNQAMSRSAIVSTQVALAEVQAAITRRTATIAQLNSLAATAQATGNNQRYLLIQNILNAQEQKRNILLAQRATLLTRLNGLQRATTAGAVAMRGLMAAGSGLLGMLGGPLGIALMGATIGITHLMTKETEAERVSRVYGNAIDELAKQHRLLGQSAEEAGDSINYISRLSLEADIERVEKSIEEVQKAIENTIASAFGLSDLDKSLALDWQTGLVPVGLDKATEKLKRDLHNVVLAVRGGKQNLVTVWQEFENVHKDELKKFPEFKEISKKLLDGDEKEKALMLSLLVLLQRKIDLTKQLGKTNEETSNINSLDALLTKEINFAEKSIKVLSDLGINIQSIDLFDVTNEIKKLQEEEAAINKFFNNTLNTAKTYRANLQGQLNNLFSQSTQDQEQIDNLQRRIQKVNDDILMYESAKLAEQKQIWADFYADQAVKEQEILRVKKLSTEEELEIRKDAIQQYMEAEKEKATAVLKIKIAESDATVKFLKANFEAFMATSYAATQFGLNQAAILASQFAIANAGLAQLQANLNTINANFKTAVSGIIQNIGTAAGGASKGMADTVRDQAKALQEVELTMARMENNQIKVIEIEQVQELEKFNEQLKKAGIEGAKAAEYLERFKIASQQKVNTENLEAQISFYEKLRDVMPQAGAEYEKIRQEILETELAQLRAIGIQEEYLQAYKDMQTIRESTSAVDGLRVAIHDYTSNLTPAKAAQGLFNDVMSATSDALVKGIFDAGSFGDAMTNLGNVVVAALQRMLVEMLVIRPIMESFNSLLGGGLGNFFSSLFGGTVSLSSGSNSVMARYSAQYTSFHKGGIIGGLNKALREANPLAFVNAPRMHGGGLAGIKYNEVPIIAERGEMVLTRADQANLLNFIRSMDNKAPAGGTQLNVQVINRTSVGVEAETSASQNSNGGIDLQVLLREIDSGLAKRQSAGISKLDKNMRSTYQLNGAEALYRRG